MEDTYPKFVDFAKYCPRCKFSETKETDDPCNACLTVPARTDGSRKPVNFKEED